MKKVSNILIISAIVFAFGLAGPVLVFAATSPPLGSAATYGILSNTYTNPTGPTTINGDVGFTTGPAVTPLGVHANYGSGAPYAAAGTAQAAALTDLNNQACDFTFAAPAVVLDTTGEHSSTYGPGVYCSNGAMSVGTAGGITLSGSGTYIFRSGGALNAVAGSTVNLGVGASACDVFWTPNGATTLNANSTFIGTVIPVSQDITVLSTTAWTGRALAFGNTVTTPNSNVVISVPACSVPPATLHVIKHVINDNGGSAAAGAWMLALSSSNGGTGTGSAIGNESPGTIYTLQTGKAYSVAENIGPGGYTESHSAECIIPSAVAGTIYNCTITNDDIGGGGSVRISTGMINVVKVVVNDNGGTKTVADFPLFVNGTRVVSGESNTFYAPDSYRVTETIDPNYTQVFSGNCNASGYVGIDRGQTAFCIITNNDIGSPALVLPVPPLIDVVKIPSPLSLPAGPGAVTYTYTARNIGTVPMTNVTMVGDTCSPIVLFSGDTNTDAKLDINETWVYRCSTVLSLTHTNTVVATGWANGISAVDIASATVIVGIPVVPPLIHVTKVPNPLALFAGWGSVTYTNKITNPGTIPLSNVGLSDDKCGPVKYVSGDVNGDSKLDPMETWNYICQADLTKTTTNTVVATGQANGLTASDFAIATVIVSTPSFPNTGLPSISVSSQQIKTIAIDLGKGDSGSNVKILQQFLISQNKGSAAQILANNGTTMYFGGLTKAALAEFQASVQISPAIGNFGPITRAYIKAHY